MKTYRRAKAAALLAALFLAAGCASKGEKLPLDNESWAWTPTPQQVENIPAEKVAEHSWDGKVLTVGPWIAGNRDIRLVSQFSLPIREGSLKGEFRTEGMYPREGNIWISFYKGDKRVCEQNYWLGVTSEWTSFNFPVFAPPPECDRIEVAFGFHMKTHGKLQIRDLRFGDPHQLPDIAPEPTLTRASRPERGEPSKYIRLTQNDGTWWLVDTDGKAMYPLACAMYGNRLTPEESYPTMTELSFNTLANGSDLKAWKAFNDKLVAEGKKPFYQFYRIDTHIGRVYDGLMDAKSARNYVGGVESKVGADVGGFDHAFADPFDPRWVEDVRRQVATVLETFGDSPYFLGWMAGNERSHYNLYRYVWSPNCGREFVKWLEGKYGDIDKLNKAWESSFASFEDLHEQMPEPLVIEGAKFDDFNAFSKIVVRTFNETILSIIHEMDPGRLVFSNRFMIHEVRGVFDNMDCYSGFDGMAINLYPSNDVWGLDMSERQYFELMHELTGKPLMVCEWSVPARDSHLYDNWNKLDWSFPQLMRTQTLRARQIAQCMADWYNMPFIVGTHWFTWADFDSPTRQSNRGMFKSNGEPWPEVMETLGSMNKRITKEVEEGSGR